MITIRLQSRQHDARADFSSDAILQPAPGHIPHSPRFRDLAPQAWSRIPLHTGTLLRPPAGRHPVLSAPVDNGEQGCIISRCSTYNVQFLRVSAALVMTLNRNYTSAWQ